MASDNVVLDRERPFALHELFFSSTDLQGRIRAGNETFQTVSGYEIDELVGMPHNVVRHPDMPRVVFRVLWDRLGAGEPVAAYVKNRSKDGAYYWVMALAFPTESGYTSVRLKPTSPLLHDVVEPLYHRLLEVEASHDDERRSAAMDASAEVLDAALGGLGFADYDDFMRRALAVEVSARRAALGSAAAPPQPTSSANGTPLAEMLGSCVELEVRLAGLNATLHGHGETSARFGESTHFFAALAEQVGTLAMNARLTATRAGSSVAVLEAIAQLMTSCAAEAGRVVAELNGALAAATASIRRVGFLTAAADLEAEMLTQFLDELVAWGREEVGEVASVWDLVRSTEAHLDGLDADLEILDRSLASLPHALGRLERCLHELRALRVRAIVEASRIAGADEFAAIMGGISERLGPAIERCASLLEMATNQRGIDARQEGQRIASLVRRLHDVSDPALT